jgi:hypothetical protein
MACLRGQGQKMHQFVPIETKSLLLCKLRLTQVIDRVDLLVGSIDLLHNRLKAQDICILGAHPPQRG